MPPEKISEENQSNLSSVNSDNVGKNNTNTGLTGFVDNTPEAANAKILKEQLNAKGPQQMREEMAERVALSVTDVESLARRITSPGYIESLTDEGAMEILQTVFGSNWFHAKDVLLMDGWGSTKPDHSYGLALMKKFITLRTNTWAAFVAKTVPKIVAAVDRMKGDTAFADLINPAELEKNLKLGVPAGSDALTADIDIPLKGENTEIGLNVLNGAFSTEFGVESGTLFDINLYASDWMFAGNQIAGEKGVVTYLPKEEFAKNPETGKGFELDDAGIAKKDNQNEIWSMVKIRRNMVDDVEWAEYKSAILSQITDENELRDTAKKCAVVEQEFAKFDASVKDRIQLMFGATFDEMDHYKKEAATTTASNSIYEEKALMIKALRLEIKKMIGLEQAPSVIETRVLALHKLIAESLTYANEVYATQGAVLHTVYGKQGAVKETTALKTGKKEDGSVANVDLGLAGVTERKEITGVKYALRSEMYLQSANENVGDTLHSLNHYEENGPYGAYRAGKYLDRLVEATEFLLGKEKAKALPGYAELLEIAQNAVKEKKGEDGKISAGSDPMVLTVDGSYFKNKTPKDLIKIKALTKAFGVAMTTTYKNEVKTNR
jgi:hypothetical protein